MRLKMGKELVRQYIIKRAKYYLIGGIILTVISAVILYFQITKGSSISFIILTSMFLLCGIVFAICGIVQMVNPFSAEEVKRNPELFQQIEELMGHETYKDKFMSISERVIGNTGRPLQMAYKDEVFLIYVYTQKLNGATNSKFLKVETAVGTLQIDIMGEKDNIVDELVQRICENCRYAKVGYTPESLKYLEDMRQMWKKDRLIKRGWNV